jgi:hypothetical protein
VSATTSKNSAAESVTRAINNRFLYSSHTQALFVLLAIAYVAAIPVDESVIGDSADNFHPTDDQEILKKLLLKKLLLKKKLLFG